MRVSVLDFACQLVYYPYMVSVVGKKRGNQTYYYLVESARVDGKPRIVAQEYLGSAQEVMDRLSGAGPGRPERTQHKAFGGLAAVWGILDRLGWPAPSMRCAARGAPMPGRRSGPTWPWPL